MLELTHKIKCYFGYHEWSRIVSVKTQFFYAQKGGHSHHECQRICAYCEIKDKPMKLSKFKRWYKKAIKEQGYG